MRTAISPEVFFSAWRSVCTVRQGDILGTWDDTYAYTRLMLGNREGTIVREVAKKLPESDTAWRCYCEYYSLDAIFYLDGDLVAQIPEGSTWLANTRIVFEHENDFTSGLFQEVSHLMITRADLRVLVTYPQGYDLETELKHLADVIRRSGLAEPNFLLITGKGVRGDNGAWKEVDWQAYTYHSGQIILLNR